MFNHPFLWPWARINCRILQVHELHAYKSYTNCPSISLGMSTRTCLAITFPPPSATFGHFCASSAAAPLGEPLKIWVAARRTFGRRPQLRDLALLPNIPQQLQQLAAQLCHVQTSTGWVSMEWSHALPRHWRVAGRCRAARITGRGGEGPGNSDGQPSTPDSQQMQVFPANAAFNSLNSLNS